MDTNQQQVNQAEGIPSLGFPFGEPEGQHEKKTSRPSKEAAADPPGCALAVPAQPVALAEASPWELANQFASFDAEQAKKEFADLSEEIRGKTEAFACACKDAAEKWDELTPRLSRMQALLSQRGEKRQAVLREAGLPTWTEWFEGFKKDLGLKISLRAVQKRLAKLRDKSAGGKVGRAGGCRKRAKPESEKAPYKHGYQAAKAELQPQLKAAAERQDALGKRIAELEGDNKRLRGIADEVQQQLQESVDGAAANLPPQFERLKELAKLAAEAFRIINGRFGERLMGSPDGNRLVELAKKAAAIKWKGKTC
jgi:DNA repair exonuclease SbcCD ATPase subunit